jgi:hypothetical protein
MAMTNFLCLLMVTAFLMFSQQQEATPPAPTLAEAARAARERPKSSKPKHIVTDDDVSHNGSDAGFAAGVSESQVRARLQGDATIPRVPTAADLINRINDFSLANGISAASESANYKQKVLSGHQNAPFPGQKEWEEQMDTAVKHFVEEAGTAATRLHAILEENKDALAHGDPATPQKVRQEWIEALVPFTTSQLRLHQLMLEGDARAKASSSKPQAH